MYAPEVPGTVADVALDERRVRLDFPETLDGWVQATAPGMAPPEYSVGVVRQGLSV